MLLVFLLICFNFLFFKIFLPAFLPCLFLKNLACALVVGVLGRFVVGGYLHALELVPWWLVAGWLLVACLGAYALVVGCWLVGSWLVCPLLMYLGVCVLLVGVLGGGYLHTLELVSCWLIFINTLVKYYRFNCTR